MLFAATSLKTDAWRLSVEVGGKTDMSAPVSIKNESPEVESLRNRRLVVGLFESVAEIE